MKGHGFGTIVEGYSGKRRFGRAVAVSSTPAVRKHKPKLVFDQDGDCQCQWLSEREARAALDAYNRLCSADTSEIECYFFIGIDRIKEEDRSV